MVGERVDVVEAHVVAGARRRSVQCARAGRRTAGAVTSLKFAAPSALVSTKNRSPAAADVVLDVVLVALLAWLDDVGSGVVASSASTNHTSVVSFDADVISRNRPVRVRSTRTKKRSSSSWKTSTSSSAGVPRCAATPARGASRRRAARRSTVRSSSAHARP